MLETIEILVYIVIVIFRFNASMSCVLELLCFDFVRDNNG